MIANTATIRTEPFAVHVDDADLEDLRARLARTRWTDAIPGAGWDYGVDLDWAKSIATYWRTEYDWRAAEAAINAWPQFRTVIDGQRIHFLHIRSSRPHAVPLLLIHGWPGSVFDFLGLITPLTEPDDPSAPAFDLVVPSLPGFGFSGPTHARGWDETRSADAFATLMRGLGYDRYAVHGGDFGSGIAREIGIADRDHLIGVHVLEFWSFPNGTPGEIDALTADDRARLQEFEDWGKNAGYFTMQGSRPQTLGFGLADSPVGQLTWNLDFTTRFSGFPVAPIDHLLTNVTLYWLTNTAGSAARIYYEAARAGNGHAVNHAPTGLAMFANNAPPIRAFAERDNSHIVRWTEFDHGGHFASLEAPDDLIAELRAFIGDLLVR